MIQPYVSTHDEDAIGTESALLGRQAFFKLQLLKLVHKWRPFSVYIASVTSSSLLTLMSPGKCWPVPWWAIQLGITLPSQVSDEPDGLPVRAAGLAKCICPKGRERLDISFVVDWPCKAHHPPPLHSSAFGTHTVSFQAWVCVMLLRWFIVECHGRMTHKGCRTQRVLQLLQHTVIFYYYFHECQGIILGIPSLTELKSLIFLVYYVFKYN